MDESEILEQSMPPDPEIVHLIEKAFPEVSIDWLRANAYRRESGN